MWFSATVLWSDSTTLRAGLGESKRVLISAVLSILLRMSALCARQSRLVVRFACAKGRVWAADGCVIVLLCTLNADNPHTSPPVV